jgi:hypothetical protein
MTLAVCGLCKTAARVIFDKLQQRQQWGSCRSGAGEESGPKDEMRRQDRLLRHANCA